MKKRRHHYIWRNYLKTWSNNNQIWCLRDGKIFQTNLMNVGQKRDFYKLNDLTQEDILHIQTFLDSQSEPLQKLNQGWIEIFTIIFKIKKIANNNGLSTEELETEVDEQIHNLEENIHSQIESNAIKFLDDLNSNNLDFIENDTDLIDFIHFICVQYFRTNRMKQKVISQMTDNSIMDMKKLWNILSHIFATSLGWSIYSERTQWNIILLNNETNVCFITTDQPVINTFVAHGGVVKEHDDLEFYYPLSPTKALLVTKLDTYNSSCSNFLGVNEVERYNKGILGLSYELIFASSKGQLDLIHQS